MKTSSIIRLAKASVALLAMPALGQTGPVARNSHDSVLFGQPVRATQIIGCTIKNLHDEKLGTVKDLALDLQNGRIVEIVAACGGFLSVDQKLVAVPPQNFNAEPGGKSLLVSMDKATLEGALPVDLFNWSEAMNQTRVKAVYQYFRAKPYFLDPEFLSQNAAEVKRAGQLIHLTTLNHRDAKVGDVQDLIINLPAGRVVEVIIASGRFLGIQDELSAVPPQVLRFKPDRPLLTLNTTAKALAEAPSLPPRAWPRIDRDQIAKVYRAYDMVPYFMPLGMEDMAQIAGEVECGSSANSNSQHSRPVREACNVNNNNGDDRNTLTVTVSESALL